MRASKLCGVGRLTSLYGTKAGVSGCDTSLVSAIKAASLMAVDLGSRCKVVLLRTTFVVDSFFFDGVGFVS